MIMGVGLLCFGKGRVEAEIPFEGLFHERAKGGQDLFPFSFRVRKARRDGFF